MQYPPNKLKVYLLLEEDFEHSNTRVRVFTEYHNAYTEFCKYKNGEEEILDEGKDFYQVEDSEFEEMVGYQVSIIETIVEDFDDDEESA